ncbi:DNA polymerase [Brevibacillus daliensis]|uniref:DNA polymerase n=1 Tax=Brevibacillus daliensis TaxID=2892995 RepID=UPI0028160AFF|nr:DNA polymerase [Brevibacillus daliensis]
MTLKITDANYHAIVRKLISDDRKVPKGTNLQNIPAKKDGKRVRMCFVPREGYVFIGADLGQIEPRIQSHIMYTKYGDNSMRQIFIDDTGYYETMAEMTFRLPREYCVDGADDPTGTFKPRSMMKTGVLAVSYDQSPNAFAKKMHVTNGIAEMFFSQFNESFPSFKQMVTDIREGMKRTGYVETLYGRKRRFPDYKRVAAEAAKHEQKRIRLYTERKRLNAKDKQTPADESRLSVIQAELDILRDQTGLVGYWERAAFNAVIQGTGADILKMNGNRMARICKERGWEMNASIHDEVLLSVPRDQVTPETIALINDVMTKTADLSVPLTTDIVIMPRWMEEYRPDKGEWDFENCRPKTKEDDALSHN